MFSKLLFNFSDILFKDIEKTYKIQKMYIVLLVLDILHLCKISPLENRSIKRESKFLNLKPVIHTKNFEARITEEISIFVTMCGKIYYFICFSTILRIFYNFTMVSMVCTTFI